MSKRLAKIRDKWTDARLSSLPGVGNEAPDTVFEMAVACDPTSQHKMVDWTLTAWENGGLLWEDIRTGRDSKTAKTLSDFERLKKQFKKDDGTPDIEARSLMKYATPGALWQRMRHLLEQENLIGETPGSREQKRLDMMKARLETYSYKTENGLCVDIPITEFASTILGRNTKWCTAAEDGNQFDEYNNTGPLVIFTLPDGQRFQGHLSIRTWNEGFGYDLDKQRDDVNTRIAEIYSNMMVMECSEDMEQKKTLEDMNNEHISFILDMQTFLNEADSELTPEDKACLRPYIQEISNAMSEIALKASGVPLGDDNGVDIRGFVQGKFATKFEQKYFAKKVRKSKYIFPHEKKSEHMDILLNEFKEKIEKITTDTSIREYIENIHRLTISAFESGYSSINISAEAFISGRDIIANKIRGDIENISEAWIIEARNSLLGYNNNAPGSMRGLVGLTFKKELLQSRCVEQVLPDEISLPLLGLMRSETIERLFYSAESTQKDFNKGRVEQYYFLALVNEGRSEKQAANILFQRHGMELTEFQSMAQRVADISNFFKEDAKEHPLLHALVPSFREEFPDVPEGDVEICLRNICELLRTHTTGPLEHAGRMISNVSFLVDCPTLLSQALDNLSNVSDGGPLSLKDMTTLQNFVQNEKDMLDFDHKNLDLRFLESVALLQGSKARSKSDKSIFRTYPEFDGAYDGAIACFSPRMRLAPTHQNSSLIIAQGDDASLAFQKARMSSRLINPSRTTLEKIMTCQSHEDIKVIKPAVLAEAELATKTTHLILENAEKVGLISADTHRSLIPYIGQNFKVAHKNEDAAAYENPQDRCSPVINQGSIAL